MIREHKVEHFKDFVKGMDESVKVSIARFEEFWDKVARCKPNHISFFISSIIFYEIIALIFLHRDFNICWKYFGVKIVSFDVILRDISKSANKRSHDVQ